MDRKIIASELYKIAKELLAESDYIYDPEHKKHPSGGYVKTEKGWTKKKKDEHGEKPSGDNKKKQNQNESNETMAIMGMSKFNRMDMALDKYTSTKKLDILSNDESCDVREYVAQNQNTSPEALDKLSNDEFWRVRKNVALNPQTSSKTVKKLSKDSNADVSHAAKIAIYEKEAKNETNEKFLHFHFFNRDKGDCSKKEITDLIKKSKKPIVYSQGRPRWDWKYGTMEYPMTYREEVDKQFALNKLEKNLIDVAEEKNCIHVVETHPNDMF